MLQPVFHALNPVATKCNVPYTLFFPLQQVAIRIKPFLTDCNVVQTAFHGVICFKLKNSSVFSPAMNSQTNHTNSNRTGKHQESGHEFM